MIAPGWTTRLQTVFGAPLDQLSEQNLQRLVDEGATEHSDLEFKEKPYGNSDRDRRELAADIAQFANDRGGVIVIGMREEKEVATERTTVPLDSKECDRMLSIAADRVIPYAPVQPLPIPCDEDSKRGYYLLIVPPSPDRPHAVRNGKDLRYPRRNGTQKRWLAEAEIADAYRDRFTRAQTDVDRVDRLLAESAECLRREEELPWLVVALVPSQATAFQVDAANVSLIESWAKGNPRLYSGNSYFSGPFEGPPVAGVGVRRIRLGTVFGDGLESYYGYMEIHSDGAALASARIRPIEASHLRSPGAADPDQIKITVPALTFAIASCLRAAAAVSLEVGAFGDCAVTVELNGTRLRLVEHQADHFERPVGTVAIDGPLRSRHTLTLEPLTCMSSDLLIATRLVSADIVQAFGAPELTTITRRGHLLRSAFPTGYHQNLVAISEKSGVPLDS